MALVLLALPAGLAAQGKGQREPNRPKLEAGADTNDPRAYYAVGERLLQRDPARAADAFYWAMRLDPTWGDALYARRTALLMTDPRRLVRYLQGDRRTVQNAEVQRIDSLHMRALMTNPFLYRRYERLVMSRYIQFVVNDGARPGDQLSENEIQHLWESYLMRADPATQGWAAYADGRFDDALRRYDQALKSTKRKAYLRTERGRIFQMRGRSDSAVVALQEAIEELRREDNKELVFLYDSKALLEYSIGKIHEALDEQERAREAYGRALQEDLAFYPAHVALATLALAAGDTASVVSAMELAVQLRADDPMIHLLYGYSLATLGDADGAIVQLERAIAAEPLFPRPYRLLGQVHEQRGEREKAIARYEQFIAHSPTRAPDYGAVAERLAGLKNAGGSQ